MIKCNKGFDISFFKSFNDIATPVGEARPGWKVLRVLGNLHDAEGFDYQSSEEIRDEFATLLGEVAPDNSYVGSSEIARPNGEDTLEHEIDIPIYQVDAVVRRASALQMTPEARRDNKGDAG